MPIELKLKKKKLFARDFETVCGKKLLYFMKVGEDEFTLIFEEPLTEKEIEKILSLIKDQWTKSVSVLSEKEVDRRVSRQQYK